jgi:PilZ domain
MTDRSDEKVNPLPSDRRQHARHRFIQSLTIKKLGGEAFRATSFEISESELSLATTVPLEVGDEVELSPVAKATVRAVVKRTQRTMYGLQFIDLPPDLHDRLVELRRGLPLFQTMADI